MVIVINTFLLECGFKCNLANPVFFAQNQIFNNLTTPCILGSVVTFKTIIFKPAEREKNRFNRQTNF